MGEASPMEGFAVRRTQELIDNSVFALHEALRLHDMDAVHRMRVSVRKLQQALRIFGQYLNKSGIKKVRKQLKKCLSAAGHLRNFDIALELVARRGADVPELHTARAAAKRTFRATLRQVTKKDLGLKWRGELGLPS
jgi:CHAD domain-containing protein